ncbi:MAG: PepSY domain-containing protein [Anaerolineaceae bacterium]
MSSKITLLVSALLTASMLTVVGGIVTVTANQKNAAANSTATQTAGVQATNDAAYQNALNQANQTINQANAQIINLQNQLQQQAATPTTVSYAILPDQAAAIASKITGRVVQNTPRLVSYNGTAAYEVVFQGGIVYVDANTGSVLYNGIKVSNTINSQQAAQIAINYTENSSVLGVSSGLYNNALAYQVSFTNGEIVYVSYTGTVLAVQLPSNSQSTSESEEHDD